MALDYSDRPLAMEEVTDLESLRDFLGYAIVFAPEFPEEDFLEPNEQMTLAKAFEELEGGLAYVPGLTGDPRGLAAARAMLSAAMAAHANGDERTGADELQALDRELFG